MVNLSFPRLAAGFAALLWVSGVSSTSCRCAPQDSCWPATSVWSALNTTVGGRLIKTVPVGNPCHDPNYNAAACEYVKSNWNNPYFHDQSSSSIMTPYFTNHSCSPFYPRSSACLLGTYVRYAINVTCVADAQAGLAFARKYNIRLVIRNTGHDFLGKSTGAGSLALWMHWKQDIAFTKKYVDSTYSGPAITVGSGVMVGQAYEWAQKNGYNVVGGECLTVGLTGGYTQGGGHSTLSNLYGLGADQTLAFQVILANGTLVTASKSKNTDLYWAISGGGPAAYGLVWSMTVKVYAGLPVSTALISFAEADLTKFWNAVTFYHTQAGVYADAGAFSYAFYQTAYFQIGPFMWSGGTTAQVKSILAPFIAKLDSLGITYSYTLGNYPDYYTAFNAVFAPVNTGLFQFGGRLIPRSVVQNNNAGLTTVLKKIVADGAAIIEPNIAPTAKKAGNPTNAVLPAWRDTLLHLIPALPWNDTAPDSVIAAQRDRITNYYDKMLRDMTPGSGSYMNEADSAEPDWQTAFYGSNYAKLYAIKQKYDPLGTFYAPTAVGACDWAETSDGHLCKV